MPLPPVIDAASLRGLLGATGLHVLDARFDLADPAAGEHAWRAGRIPGARHIDLDRDLSDHARPASEGRHPLPRPEALRARLAMLGIGPGDRVVVYDAGTGAMAAARAWWLLRWLGLEAAVLDGGWSAWRTAGAPVETGEPVAAAPVEGGVEWPPVHDGGCVDRDAVAHRPATALLVDARAPERFRGEVEPLDPRAGHIPGAVNRPFTENLRDGRFKSPAVLAAEWSALLAGRDPATVIVSCGSGVTACHHVLAMAHAGLAPPRLFAPSWSGWISDPDAPVATGPT